MMGHYPDLGNASDWLSQIFHAARPIKSTTQIWVVTRHRIEFLHSFFRYHLVGKPVVVSPNVGCFLRLSVALEGKDVHGSKRKRVGPTFSSFNAITTKMTWKVAS